MGWKSELVGRARRAFRRHLDEKTSSPVFYPDAFLLNELIALTPRYDKACFTKNVRAKVVFFDFDYRDREKSHRILEVIAEVERERGLVFADQTLILSAVGLDPHNERLIEFARKFQQCHVFVELWNRRNEAAVLRDAGLEHLYFFPVSANLEDVGRPDQLRTPPNRRVFVSLGGDDDIELVRAVIDASPKITFFVPNQRYRKGNVDETIPVDIRGPNVVTVPCNEGRGGLSVAYVDAFTQCDTVLIATARATCAKMRGGIRVADAIASRRRIVMTQNGMCELLMAQHERTCLVAPHDAAAIADALARTLDGGFEIDVELYEEIRSLTNAPAKLAFMIRAEADPEKAKRSAFHRDARRIENDLAKLWSSFDDGGVVAIPTLFDLAEGAEIGENAGARAKVREIRRVAPGEHEIDLAASRLIALVVSSSTSTRFTTTRRGHALSYRGAELTREEKELVDRVAELL